jgi:integrase
MLRKRKRGEGRVFDRNGVLWIAYMLLGKEQRESAAPEIAKVAARKRRELTQDEAEEVADRFLDERRREVANDSEGIKAFVGPKQDKITVGQLLDALESDLRLRELKSLAKTLGHLRIVRQYFGDMRAVRLIVDPGVVRTYIAKCQGKPTASSAAIIQTPQMSATINRRTTLLSQAYRLAIRARRVSSMPDIPRLREDNVRRGFFEQMEFEKVVKHLPEYLQGVVRFAYLVGWRRSELASLAWADVDMIGRVVRLPDSKNGEGRTLALDGELWDIISRQWRMRKHKKPDGTIGVSTLVFHRQGQPVGDFRKSWSKACAAANAPGKIFHDFRRTAGRNMIRAGVPERVAMDVIGHKTRAMFARYNIVNEADLKDAMSKTQAYLASAPRTAVLTPFRPKAKKAAAS